MSTSGPPPASPPPPPARIVIEDLEPRIDDGRFPPKRIPGEPVEVAAAVFADGHDRLHCRVSHRPPDHRWQDVPMVPEIDDRWSATFAAGAVGVHRFRVLAWIDELATVLHGIHRKREVGVDVRADALVVAELLDDAAGRARGGARDALVAAAGQAREGHLEPLLDAEASIVALVHETLPRSTATASAAVDVLVERALAARGAWYELFPRSWPAEPGRAGTLRDVAGHLPYLAEMGFDVVYLPPIHPIGTTHRKGADNATVARPGEPGSPWAIGSPDGGHIAIHPDLGDHGDLKALLAAADDEGLEVALDLAFQCSPDHPWVTEHPEWFRHRPDGSIQHAENPPKTYEDIYPLDFESPQWRGLWEALRDVVLHWTEQGIRTFRVDNPHTKPFAFWEWLIAEIRTVHPDVVLLSEAFTRPRVMHRLAKLGFSQSYTYFTWRVTASELRAYFEELAHGPGVEYLRPNAWPNTPDILPFHLQGAPRSAFAVRFVLAATLSPSYGIYGPAFELGENEPLRAGREEYLHAEKYEQRDWDLADPSSLRPLITTVNRLRRKHPALLELRTLHFHDTDNEQLLCFSKTSAAPVPDDGGPDDRDPDDRGPAEGGAVLVVVNLDPGWSQAGWVHLDLERLGLDSDRPFTVEDLLGGHTYRWDGPRNYVQLDPAEQPAHVFAVRQDR